MNLKKNVQKEKIFKVEKLYESKLFELKDYMSRNYMN